MKSIYQYSSFRCYMRDVFAEEKRAALGITIAKFSKRFDMSGPTFHMILNGKRNLTIAHLHRVASSLKLSGYELDYFEALVLRDQSADEDCRRYYGRRLKALSKAAPVTKVRVFDRRLLADWRLPAILVYLLDFEHLGKLNTFDQLNCERIAKRLMIEPAALEGWLKLLTTSKLIDSTQGKPLHVVFDRIAQHLPLKEYLKKLLVEVNRRIDKEFDDPMTFIRAFSLTVRADDVANIRSDIIEVFEKYMSRDNTSSDKKVLLQSLLVLFPVVR